MKEIHKLLAYTAENPDLPEPDVCDPGKIMQEFVRLVPKLTRLPRYSGHADNYLGKFRSENGEIVTVLLEIQPDVCRDPHKIYCLRIFEENAEYFYEIFSEPSSGTPSEMKLYNMQNTCFIYYLLRSFLPETGGEIGAKVMS